MAVATAVEGDGAVPALGTLIPMPAEGSGATAFDGPQYLQVLVSEPVTVLLDEPPSGYTNQIGHL
jgi:hypothetical protein